MTDLKWQVIAECEAKNNGKIEKFDRVIAVFANPWQAEDFIKMCLPQDRQNRFRVEHIEG